MLVLPPLLMMMMPLVLAALAALTAPPVGLLVALALVGASSASAPGLADKNSTFVDCRRVLASPRPVSPPLVPQVLTPLLDSRTLVLPTVLPSPIPMVPTMPVPPPLGMS